MISYLVISAAFTDQKDVSSRDTLLNEVAQLGLDVELAKERLQNTQYRDAVVQHERFWQEAGISAVPAVVFNRTRLMSGAQPVEAYKEVLKEFLNK